MLNQNLLLTGDDGYNLTNSLRFRSSASANLSRTFANAPTTRTKQTFSFWLKRGILSVEQRLFDCYDGTSSWSCALYLNSSNQLQFDFGGASQNNVVTTQLFRDPSAWYHIIVAIDTTQATASNRIIFYVNGVQVTALSATNYPAQNALSQWTINTANNKIASSFGNSNYLDGYLDEVNFIDGQALTPSSFGSTNALTGVWQPAKYAGTYGTNGFYLPFTDNSALTTSSNVGLGKDFSGNGNYWTTNNISITAGTTYDSMTDVPTLTNATTANYAVGNQLDKNSSGTLADGNLKWTAGASQVCVRGSFAIPTSGKYYMECLVGTASSGVNGISFGLATSTVPLTTDSSASGLYQIYAAVNRQINLNGTQTGTLSGGFSANDILQIAVDVDNQKMWLGVNNTWYNSAYTANGDPVAGTNATSTTSMVGLFPFSNCYQNSAYWNFGQRPFSYTPPTGFVALNTFNLPNSTIVAGNKQMDATTYTGNNGTQSLVNGGAFQPDLVWLKRRNGVGDNGLYDSIRGISLRLVSNSTGAEASVPLDSFNSNGFSTTSNYNNSGETLVAWQWKAGGTAVTNTAGSISAQVSANPTAGFSIVTYTGTGSNATVGHGLGVAPNWVIVKQRNATADWVMRSNQLAGNDYTLILNNTSAQTSYSPSVWNNTAPTSSVFSIGTNSAINTNTNTYVAYCWSEVAGYSKFGSYTGNGSADGAFVYTGFRPAFVMIKRTDSTGSWFINDDARPSYNVNTFDLQANSSGAESSNSICDFTANGFKIRIDGLQVNASGGTFIYMAFCENPLKYALAR